MSFRCKPAALGAAIALSFNPACAETADEAAVIVSATRFSDTDLRVPALVSVITREDIRRSPALDLPTILSTRAGIDVRVLYGSLGTDASVDIRGFGETAVSNTLILLDGQRLNPIDMGNISWSAIPLESIQRVEIIRGSGTVLYGDRASGGVVNIITDKSGRPRTSVDVTLGANNHRALNARFAGRNNGLTYNALFHSASTDGWRENSQQDEQSLSGRFGLDMARGQAFVDYSLYKDSSGLPAYLTRQVWHDHPRRATTPLNKQERDGHRIRPGVSLKLSELVDLEAEISSEDEQQQAFLGSRSWRDKETLSFTPRLRVRHGLGTLPSETIVGFDHYEGKVKARYETFAASSADQESQAFYFQNSTQLTSQWTLTLGARTQRMKQQAHQDAYPPFFMPAVDGTATRRRNAYDLGINYQGAHWRAYGKTGTTFRFANTDELFGYDAFGNPVFAGNLKPQYGKIHEIGGSFSAGTVSGRGAIYRMDLHDEIGFDGSIGFMGANANFEPTRRLGLETELEWKLADNFTTRFGYTYNDAHFRSGTRDGDAVPLVPRHKGSVAVDWNAGSFGRYSATINAVGERRYAGDLDNVRGMLSGHATLDLQAVWDMKPWTLTAKLLNALDKRYAPYAGYAGWLPGHYFYPADARSLFLTARYDFR